MAFPKWSHSAFVAGLTSSETYLGFGGEWRGIGQGYDRRPADQQAVTRRTGWRPVGCILNY
jgi:hypothetical protein